MALTTTILVKDTDEVRSITSEQTEVVYRNNGVLIKEVVSLHLAVVLNAAGLLVEEDF